MNKIATLRYDEVDFVWVQNHWDIHLSGICKYENNICYFSTNEGKFKYDEDEADFIEIVPNTCDIYSLTKEEKKSWLRRKRMFEICVGYHWTYPYRKTGEKPFGSKKPWWFWNILVRLFYKYRKCERSGK